MYSYNSPTVPELAAPEKRPRTAASEPPNPQSPTSATQLRASCPPVIHLVLTHKARIVDIEETGRIAIRAAILERRSLEKSGECLFLLLLVLFPIPGNYNLPVQPPMHRRYNNRTWISMPVLLARNLIRVVIVVVPNERVRSAVRLLVGIYIALVLFLGRIMDYVLMPGLVRESREGYAIGLPSAGDDPVVSIRPGLHIRCYIERGNTTDRLLVYIGFGPIDLGCGSPYCAEALYTDSADVACSGEEGPSPVKPSRDCGCYTLYSHYRRQNR